MSSASKVTQLQGRMGERNPRIQITEIIEQEPAPEFDSVGSELKAHRNRKGHELEMAGRVLRIKPLHIIAIEESDYAALPGKTYAIGFVRSYAEYLGLDPDDCIRRFKIEYADAMDPKPVEGEIPTRSTPGSLAFPEARDEMRLPHGSMIILGAMLVLGIWGGWYITSNSEPAFTDASPDQVALQQFETATANTAPIPIPQVRPQPEPTTPINGEEAVLSEDAATAASETPPAELTATEVVTADAAIDENGADADAVSDPVEATIEAPVVEVDTADTAPVIDGTANTVTDAAIAAEGFPLNEGANLPLDREPQVFGVQNHDSRVIVRARADVWVRIEDLASGVLFETTMKQGDSYRVPNRANIIMATRNAGALEMLVDGASIGPAGRIGQAVIEQSLNPELLAVNAPAQP